MKKFLLSAMAGLGLVLAGTGVASATGAIDLGGGGSFLGDLLGVNLTDSTDNIVTVDDDLEVGAAGRPQDFRVRDTGGTPRFEVDTTSLFRISSLYNHVFNNGIDSQGAPGIYNTGSSNGGEVLISDGLRVTGNISDPTDGIVTVDDELNVTTGSEITVGSGATAVQESAVRSQNFYAWNGAAYDGGFYGRIFGGQESGVTLRVQDADAIEIKAPYVMLRNYAGAVPTTLDACSVSNVGSVQSYNDGTNIGGCMCTSNSGVYSWDKVTHGASFSCP